MTRYLPPYLLQLFAARDPIPYEPPIKKRKMKEVNGIAQFASHFEDPVTNPPPPPPNPLTPKERRVKVRDEKKKQNDKKNEEVLAAYNPRERKDLESDAYKTLFIGRLPYSTNEKELEDVFSEFGEIKSVCIVKDLEGESKGYGFIEFDRERDMKIAYKEGERKRFGADKRRIIVDVERARTVEDWKPRRLGGGVGGGRVSKVAKKDLPKGPFIARSSMFRGGGGGFRGGGFRGRGRGGFRDGGRGRGGGRSRYGLGYGDRDRRDDRGYRSRDHRDDRRSSRDYRRSRDRSRDRDSYRDRDRSYRRSSDRDDRRSSSRRDDRRYDDRRDSHRSRDRRY